MLESSDLDDPSRLGDPSHLDERSRRPALPPRLELLEGGELRQAAGSRVLTALLWAAALAGTAFIAHLTYQVVLANSRPVDLEIYIRAAREVAGGRSPYLVVSPSKGYVYTPLLAILLAPLNHIPLQVFVRLWAVAGLVAVALAGLSVTRTEAARLRPWQRPLLFGVCLCSGFLYWPMAVELELGQIDVFVLTAFCLAAVAMQSGWRGRGTSLAAVAASIKLWPILALASALGRGASDRMRTIAISLGIGAAALGMSLVFGGVRGLDKAVVHLTGARSQQLISYSVWGVPRLWYSNGGVAAILVSPALRVGTTVVLAAFVGWMAWLALRRLDARSPLAFWHVLGCLIMLLPVSHLYYSVYFLPLLWHWAARAIRVGPREPITLGVLAVMVAWWLVMLRPWPTDGTAIPWTSSLEVSVVFLVNLAACSASVVGSWLLQRRGLAAAAVS